MARQAICLHPVQSSSCSPFFEVLSVELSEWDGCFLPGQRNTLMAEIFPLRNGAENCLLGVLTRAMYVNMLGLVQVRLCFDQQSCQGFGTTTAYALTSFYVDIWLQHPNHPSPSLRLAKLIHLGWVFQFSFWRQWIANQFLGLDVQQWDMLHSAFIPQTAASIDVQRMLCFSCLHLLLESQTRVTHWQLNAAKKGNKFSTSVVSPTTLHLEFWAQEPWPASGKRLLEKSSLRTLLHSTYSTLPTFILWHVPLALPLL